MRLAHEYLDARRAQELNHTDEALDWARTEAHDRFMLALDAHGIGYRDREHAAEIAEAMDELVYFATTWINAVDKADAAWRAWAMALQDRQVKVVFGTCRNLRWFAHHLVHKAKK